MLVTFLNLRAFCICLLARSFFVLNCTFKQNMETLPIRKQNISDCSTNRTGATGRLDIRRRDGDAKKCLISFSSLHLSINRGLNLNDQFLRLGGTRCNFQLIFTKPYITVILLESASQPLMTLPMIWRMNSHFLKVFIIHKCHVDGLTMEL